MGGKNNLVIFASGSGTNFQSIIDAVADGRIDAKITGLITNRDNIQSIDRAQRAGIPVAVIKPGEYSATESFSEALLNKLSDWNPDLIVLAGYLAMIPKQVISTYKNRMINIHPSLLPKYGGKGYFGKHVHKAVLSAGDSESGCSVHYVTEDYDTGPVIAQKRVPVLNGDTPERLAARILKEEHRLLPDIINQILTENKQ